jgi:peptidoglycan/LPS O-acetylase OafA/YrhL
MCKKVSPREAQLGRYLLVASLAYLFGFGYLYVFEPFGPAVAKYVELLKLNFGAAVPIAALIFCVSRYRSTAVAAALSAPLMILLGELSYSIYAVHTWTLRIFERPQMDFGPGLGLEAAFRIALGIALTIILSSATYRLIEVPARAWLRKAVRRRLVKSFGPPQGNRLAGRKVDRPHPAIVLALSLVGLIGLFVAYQFGVVPHFAAFTR